MNSTERVRNTILGRETDPQTVVFAYNRSFEDNSILPVIRLEIGALAAWTPADEKIITPYAAVQYLSMVLLQHY